MTAWTAAFGTASDWLEPTVTVPVDAAAGRHRAGGVAAAAGGEQRRGSEQGAGAERRRAGGSRRSTPRDGGGNEAGEVLGLGRRAGMLVSFDG